MPFNFKLIHTNLQAKKIKNLVLKIEKYTKGKGWPNYLLGNHDDE